MTPVSKLITRLSTVCILFFTFLMAHANGDENAATIKGTITTSDNKPATYVTVILKGTNKSAFTDEDGVFSFFNVRPGSYEIEVSLVGHNTVTKQINVTGDNTVSINIQLTASNKQLQEVIVTGGNNKYAKKVSDFVSKMPLKSMENSQVYTTISKNLIADQMVFTVDDALKNAPGINKMWIATGRSGDGGSYYNSRGFVLQSQLRNGVAGNVSSTIDAANIERIEIIKGPSATLFGSTLTSYGGLINRVTKKPYEKVGGEIAYAGGSYNFNRFSVDVNTPLDSAKTVLLRVNAAYNAEKSFTDNGFSKGFSLAPSLSYKVNDKLSFLFDAEFYQGQNTGLNVYFFPWLMPMSKLSGDSPDKLKMDYKKSYANSDLYQTARNANFFAEMDYKMGNGWRSQTTYSITNSFSDGPSPYFYLLPGDSISRNNQFTDHSTNQVMELQQNFIGDFHIGKFRNRFVGGLDFFYQNYDQVFYNMGFDTINLIGATPNYMGFNKRNVDAMIVRDWATIDAYNYPLVYKTNTYSAYISDVFNLLPNLMLSAALRLDHFDNKGNFNKSTGTITPGSAYNQTALAPKFGIVYQPIKDRISIFANYQNGFTNKTGVDYEGNSFKPEQANQFETGVKLDMFGGKLSSTLSYYNIEVSNMVRSMPTPNNPYAQIQDGTQRSTGFEGEVITNPIKGLNVSFGLSYNDSKYTKADASVLGRRPATATSPWASNFWISYNLQVEKLRGLGVGFGGNYVSDYKVINDANVGEFTLPSYTVLGATLFYEQGKYRIGVKLDNLTNEHYWIGYSSFSPQKLRSVTANIAFRF